MRRRSNIQTNIDPDSVYLRPLKPSDVTTEYVGWLNDPEVNRFLEVRYQVPHTNSSTRSFVQQCIDTKRIHWGIFIDSAHVGNVTCTPDLNNEHTSIASLIGSKKYRGTQLAKYAVGAAISFIFSELKLHRIEAGVYSNHLGGIALLTSLGFQKEGVLKERAIFDDGSRVDLSIYGLIESQWSAVQHRLPSLRVTGPTKQNLS